MGTQYCAKSALRLYPPNYYNRKSLSVIFIAVIRNNDLTIFFLSFPPSPLPLKKIPPKRKKIATRLDFKNKNLVCIRVLLIIINYYSCTLRRLNDGKKMTYKKITFFFVKLKNIIIFLHHHLKKNTLYRITN